MVLKAESDAADEASFFVINPCPDDLEKAKHEENYLIPRDADERGETRPWAAVVKCPCAEHCNVFNYKKACVWSFQSTDMCLRYLLNHLWNKHHMTQAEGVLCIQCSDLQWQLGQDTYDERETYRVHLEKGQGGQGSSKKARTMNVDQALAKTSSMSSTAAADGEPTVANDADEICFICQDIMLPTDTKFWLPCVHKYHRDCFHSYAESKRMAMTGLRCPICKTPQSVGPKAHWIAHMIQDSPADEDDAGTPESFLQMVLRNVDVQHVEVASSSTARPALLSDIFAFCTPQEQDFLLGDYGP